MSSLATQLGMMLASYTLGCLTVGHYLVRFRTGQDTRRIGSGSAGSANVSRVLGAPGFALTLLGDAAKGALAVWTAWYFGLGSTGMMLVTLAVVAGHIWPVQLGFRGGKGLATTLGAVLVFDYRIALVAVVAALILLALLRQPVASGLLGVATGPGVAVLVGHEPVIVVGMGVLAVVLFFAHRSNIRQIFREARQQAGESH